MKLLRPIAAVIAILLCPAFANAQGGFGGGGGGTGGGGAGGGFGGGNGGFQQSGQLTSAAAIQRDSNSSVFGNSGSFLSRAAGGAAGGRGGLAGLTSTLGAFGGGGFGGRGFGGGFGGQGGFGNQFNMGQTGNALTGNQQLRIPVRVGFVGRPISPTLVSSQFSRRLTSIPALGLKSPVAVRMDGRTAVLQGAVSNERQRDLVARLALLEPGISAVRNELTVDEALAQPELLPGAATSSPAN